MDELIAALRRIVGRGHVLTGAGPTRRFTQGYRFGGGGAIAVVRPGTLIEQWRALAACLAADVSVVHQAANTGLTGGSTPNGDDYPGGVVVISLTRITGIHLIDGGRQVVCLPGATLYDLERRLAPLGREPHSVIGSSCLGASVLGGVCNNSGGALVRRGSAFTTLALFARVDGDGQLALVNHLGIRLGGDAEAVLACVEAGDWTDADVVHDPARAASDRHYAGHVREIDADSPARYNADPRCHFECSGSAGKVSVFAVRLDTFAAEAETATFYIGTNDPDRLTDIRRTMLRDFAALPIAAEYVHRTAFDIAARYGKDTYLAIKRLGTGRLPAMFALKARVDALAARLRVFGAAPSDRLMQAASRLFPSHLPPRLIEWRDRFEHHLLLKVAAEDAADTRRLLDDVLRGAGGDAFECTPDEAEAAFLHRFAVAGAAVRYRAVHRAQVEDIVALDIALPRNARDWRERLTPDAARDIVHVLYYGHFFCHVFHQDYIVRKGADPEDLEHRLLAALAARGARYPAEHNVGHLYHAEPALERHYRALDPRNQLNPGIGRTSRQRFWGDAAPLAVLEDAAVGD